MKIGFDVSQTGQNKAGCGYFAQRLIHQLTQIDTNNTYLLYANFGAHFWDPAYQRATFQIDQANVHRQFAHFKSHAEARNFWLQLGGELEEQLGCPTIIQANNYFCPRPLRKARLIYTVYDLAFLRHPDLTTEANRLICFEGVYQASLTADKIVTISHFSKQQFLETFPHYPADQVHVLYPASRFSMADKLPAKDPFPFLAANEFWLSVGTLEPRKNIRRLLQAYAHLKRQRQTALPLVLAGGQGWLEESLPRFISELGLQEQVHLLGYVSDSDLLWLYRHCYAFIYPSLFEGFGLPVIEALSQQTAVITTNVSSIPEVAGEAALLVDPKEVEQIMVSMRRLEGDAQLKNELQRKALTQSKKFTWQNTAQKQLELYDELTCQNK